MKHINLLLIALLAIVFAGCSSSKEVSQADIMKHNKAVERLEKQNFVIKADRLVFNKRTFPSVSSSTNFVMVDGENATVQISPAFGGGPNGVGGFTVKGGITAYDVKVKSNGAVNVKFNVMATVGSCTVYINLPKNATTATVSIHNTFHGKNATIYGSVTPIDNSIFVGQTRF